jgi:hypothetical protein
MAANALEGRCLRSSSRPSGRYDYDGLRCDLAPRERLGWAESEAAARQATEARARGMVRGLIRKPAARRAAETVLGQLKGRGLWARIRNRP